MSRRFWLSVCAVLGLILAGQVHAQTVGKDSSGKPRPAQSEAKPKPDLPPAIPVAVQDAIKRIPSAIETANSKQPSSTDERNARAQEKVADWTPALFFLGAAELLLTAVGIFLVWCTLLQTKNAAQAARDTVNSMEDSSKRQLRAYVGVEKIAFDCENFRVYTKPYAPGDSSVPGAGCNDFLCVTIKNFGQTPAFDTVVYGYWVTGPPNVKPDPGFFENLFPEVKERASIRTISSHTLLQRDQIHSSRMAIWDLTPVLAAQKNERGLYLFGRIYYRDAFNRPWRTKFCFSWQPEVSGDFEFVPYEEHNDEDNKPFPGTPDPTGGAPPNFG
jgi:hypothetical protein